MSRSSPPTPADRSPARLSAGLAVALATVALAAAGPFAWVALALAGLGVALVGLGVVRARPAGVTLGAVALFAGLVVAGVRGAPAPALLVGGVAMAVAWDVGRYAIELGWQLGRGASTRRLELRHAGASLVVGAATAGVGYGAYAAAGGGQPIAALAFLLVGAIALASAVT